MEILAKSEPRISLKEHIDDCLVIFRYLKICFPKAKEIVPEIDFWNIVRISIIMHDLGKAHSEFAKVLQGLKNEWNRQRHELFSLPFIDGLDIGDSTKQLIRLAVAGHHRDFERLNKDYISNTYSNGNTDDEFGDEGLVSYEDELKKVNVTGVISLLKNDFQIDLDKYLVKSPQKLILSYLHKSTKGEFNIKSEH